MSVLFKMYACIIHGYGAQPTGEHRWERWGTIGLVPQTFGGKGGGLLESFGVALQSKESYRKLDAGVLNFGERYISPRRRTRNDW